MRNPDAAFVESEEQPATLTTESALAVVWEFVNSGESRKHQLEHVMRDVYRDFGFDPQNDTPSRVLSELLHLKWNKDGGNAAG